MRKWRDEKSRIFADEPPATTEASVSNEAREQSMPS